MPNYPVPYQNNWGYSGIGQQLYPQFQQMQNQALQGQTQSMPGLIWVDGEIGAKAYMLPAGLPANQPIALWDTNDTVIYLKSINQMGMPNPLQKARYKLEGTKSGEAQQAFTGENDPKQDMTKYVRKEDMERMKQELMETINSMNTGSARRRTKEEE